MNTQLVDSIIQVVQALPQEEQQLLIERLNLLHQPKSTTVVEATGKASEQDSDAWEIWRTLGDDAVPGRLENPSVNHDRYLYSKES